MNRELENYYLKQQEPIRSCVLALKTIDPEKVIPIRLITAFLRRFINLND